jgi:hypothetical protein
MTGNPEGNIYFVKQSKLQTQGNPAHLCHSSVGDFTKNSNGVPSYCSYSPLPVLQTYSAIPNNLCSCREFFKVILALYEQFSELSSSLCGRYRYDTGCTLSGVKGKSVGKNRFLHNRL